MVVWCVGCNGEVQRDSPAVASLLALILPFFTHWLGPSTQPLPQTHITRSCREVLALVNVFLISEIPYSTLNQILYLYLVKKPYMGEVDGQNATGMLPVKCIDR